MQPFNLEKALAGATVVTRDGIPATDFHYFEREKSVFNVSALVDGYVHSFTKRGEYCLGVEHEYDLFMDTVSRTMWGIMYRDCADDNGNLYLYPFLYPTEENARSEIERLINVGKKAIKVFPIEWDE
jgi:hypothetical protein